MRGVAGCSKESCRRVSGDAVSLRLNNFEIRSKLCVRRCGKLAGAMIVYDEKGIVAVKKKRPTEAG